MALGPLGLFKFGKKSHIHDFISNGHLFMNPLQYFKTIEDAESPKTDRHEAATFITRSTDGALLRCEVDCEFVDVGTIRGPMIISEDSATKSCVFCMYAFIEDSISSGVDIRNFAFGDTYVVLTEGDEFLRRVRAAADRAGIEVEMGLVSYVDKETHQGEMGVFRKFSGFAYQSEFRIVIRSAPTRPYSLCLGNLSDIAIVGPLKEINSRLRYEETETGSYRLLVKGSC